MYDGSREVILTPAFLANIQGLDMIIRVQVTGRGVSTTFSKSLVNGKYPTDTF